MNSKDIIKRIESNIPENPYPIEIFTMTIDDYIKEIPDEKLRSSINGCIGRWAWDIAIKRFMKLLKEEFEDER